MPLNLEPERHRLEAQQRAGQEAEQAKARAVVQKAEASERIATAIAPLASEAVEALRAAQVPLGLATVKQLQGKTLAAKVNVECWDLRYPRELFGYPHNFDSPFAFLTPDAGFIGSSLFVQIGPVPGRTRDWPQNWDLEPGSGRVIHPTRTYLDDGDLDHPATVVHGIGYVDNWISRLVASAIHDYTSNPATYRPHEADRHTSGLPTAVPLQPQATKSRGPVPSQSRSFWGRLFSG